LRNVTYLQREGRFCIIDFEYATILDDPNQKSPEKFPDKKDLVKATAKARRTTLIKWSSMSHIGTVRTSNEDAFLAVSFNQHGFQYLGDFGQAELKHDGHVFAVSDGMGGANAGEYASKVAVAKINEYLPKAMPYGDTTAVFKNSCERMFSEIFNAIHQALIYLGECYEECQGMGSTLSLCWFTQSWLYFAHIGDTKIYHLPAKGGMKQISEDHTLVGSLLRSGKITEYEARAHPRRNALQRSLGAHAQIINFQSGFLEHASGDMFLICSDGVNAGLWSRQIHSLLRQPDENEIKLRPANRVVQTAVEKSGKDNTTAVVIEIS
ncbi:MAG: protein phosphatase 2C domain-containing protein, partial [Verrucomicrobiota bacterium]